MKCKDFLIKLVYLSVLPFAGLSLNSPPHNHNTLHTVLKCRVCSSFFLLIPDLLVHVISFLLRTPFPHPAFIIGQFFSSLKTYQASSIPYDWIKCPSNQPSKHPVLIGALLRLYNDLLDGQHIQHLVRCLTLGKGRRDTHWYLDSGLPNLYSSYLALRPHIHSI